MKPVYLDNNATTRIDPAVLAAMLPYFTEHFGNASSSHALGVESSAAIHAARGKVQALTGAAHAHEVIFTSGGTESDNAAILSALEAQPDRNEIVLSAVEHPAALSLAMHLQRQGRAIVRLIPVDARGRLDIAAYKAALGPQTAVASIMWANNETGVIFPVAQLAEIAHEKDVLFHTDAVQAAGRMPIDVAATKIDMLSLSAHKFHGPKGIGALYVRKGVRFNALIRGGKQERGRRAGTENTPAIVGLGRAADLAQERLGAGAAERIRLLRDRFEAGVLRQVNGSSIAGGPENRLPNTSAIVFECADGEAILAGLNKAGVAASSGSACTSGSTEPSHVLRAMKLPYTAALGAIRFSFSHENSNDDVNRALAVLPAIVEKSREASGFASAGAFSRVAAAS
jgi:cysteine desulfurase